MIHYFTSTEMAISKRPSSIGKDSEKLQFSFSSVGNKKWVNCYGKPVTELLRKLNRHFPYGLALFLHSDKKMCFVPTKTSTQMFTAVSFLTGRK